MDIGAIILEYLRPDFVVLAIALYLVGIGLKKTALVKDEFIPLILGGIGIILAAVWIFATNVPTASSMILQNIYNAIVQGILCAAADVFINQVSKQAAKLKESK